MTVIEREKSKIIAAYEAQLDQVCAILDEYFIAKYGEDAAWEDHVGAVAPPSSIDIGNIDRPLWLAREQCNSTLHWEQNEHPNEEE